MSDQEERERPIVRRIWAALVGAGVPIASRAISPFINDPAFSSLIEVAGTTIGPMVSMFLISRDLKDMRAAYRLSEGIKEAAGEAPEIFVQELEAKIGEQWVQDGIVESFRSASNALDSRVIPYLGRLFHAYTSSRVDRQFFRSFGRLLSEVDIDELDALRKMLKSCVEDTRPIPEVHAGRGAGNVHNSNRLLLLLKNNELAVAPDTFGDDGSWGESGAETDAGTGRSLWLGHRNDAAIPRQYIDLMLLIITAEAGSAPEAGTAD